MAVTHEGVLERSRPPLEPANDPAPPVAALANDRGRSCADCMHLLPRRTCGEPASAGLLTEAEGFGLVWPPDGHGAGCAAFSGPKPAKAKARPYRLTKDGADAAHAEPWGDAAIARFQSRVQRFMRLGLVEQDAEDLADRLHLRDMDDDERRGCLECDHYRPGRCGNHRVAALGVPELSRELAGTSQRCPGFKNAR